MAIGSYNSIQDILKSGGNTFDKSTQTPSPSTGGMTPFKDVLASTSPATPSATNALMGHFSNTIGTMRATENLALQAAMGEPVDPTQVDTAVVQSALKLEEATKALNGFVGAWNDLSKMGL